MKANQNTHTPAQKASADNLKSEHTGLDGSLSTWQPTENRTGLPDNLKAGIENLSGYSMDDVKVHYNSPQPATLQAHAYAQGTDIHVASGQERYLPHEAWHVVQQKQGRVSPTKQLKGKVPVNDDAGLEQEADSMGAKAFSACAQTSGVSLSTPPVQPFSETVQRVIMGEEGAVGRLVRKKSTDTLLKVSGYTPPVDEEGVGSYDVKDPEKRKDPSTSVSATDADYDLVWPLKEYTEKEFNALKTDADKVELEQVHQALKGRKLVFATGKKGSFTVDTPALAFIAQMGITPSVKEKLYAFFNPARHTNTSEQFDKISKRFSNKTTYKDWFHSFTATITLLSARKDMDPQQMKKLLKYQLTKFQIQATYGSEDGQRLGRQTSPLVLKGYARGIKTGLWNLNRRLQEDAVNKQLEKASKQPGARLGKEFYVFPANKSFPVEVPQSEPKRFMKLTEKDTVPPDINKGDYESVYINSLRVQLVKFASAEAKSKEIGPVHSQMGGKGLRLSAGQSADVAAGLLVDMIRMGNVDAAMKYVADTFEPKSEPGEEGSTKEDVSPAKAFGGMEFSPNTLLVPVVSSVETGKKEALDPLTGTSLDELVALQVQYAGLVRFMGDGTLPFYIRQNIEVVRNLVGEDNIGPSHTGGKQRFFDQKSPTTVVADLIDALQNARLVVAGYKELRGEDRDGELISKETNLLVERFYQQMQNIHHAVRFQLNWKNVDTTLDTALPGMLTARVKPILTQAAPHGLEMIHHIQQSLKKEDRDNVSYMKGAYYETPELFPKGKQKEDVTDPSLRKDKVIVMEPHPNNAAEREVKPHDPLKLLDNLFKERPEAGPYTVIMDVTLNHLADEQIKAVLEKAEPYINSGKLNLILLQSGTKFFQNGMDLVNIGTAMTFNNGEGPWDEFNKNMRKHKENLPEEDKQYIAHMLSQNKEPLRQYLGKVRSNTTFMRSRLTGKLAEGKNAFEMCKNTDDTTVYVSFMPTAAYIHKVLALKQKSTLKKVETLDKGSEELYIQAALLLDAEFAKKQLKLSKLLGPQRKKIEALLKQKNESKVEREKQEITRQVATLLGTMKLKKQLMLVLGKNIQSHEEHSEKTTGLYTNIAVEDIAAINQDLYHHYLMPALASAGSASVDRSSFGFNVTNFGECYTTVRITMGIEDVGFLTQYADTVQTIGADAYQRAFGE